MDSPTSRNNETEWVEDRIAMLAPPPEWEPDAARAFQRLNQTRDLPSGSRWLRLSMAGVIFAATVVVLLLLPWQAFWTSRAGTASVQVGEAIVPLMAPAESATTPPTKPAQRRWREPKPSVVTPPSAATEEAKPGQTDNTREALPRMSQRYAETEGKFGIPPAVQRQGNPGLSQSDVTQPVVVTKVQPQYTQEAKEAKIQGVVELSCTIQTDGSVTVDTINKGLGYGLDESASAAVEQWRFEPAKKNGVPVAVSVAIVVNFSLR